MRPQVDVEECELYECPACGTQVEAPDGETCETCGAYLQCLSNERDF